VPDLIITRAPTRIDFGGGWTDVPPYADEVGGFVCNLAIARYATVRVERGDRSDADATSAADRGIVDAAARRFRMRDAHISVASDFPIGAGLGGSSAVGVAAVAALAAARGERMQPSAIAELSREIEISDLGIAGGRQDHYAAAYGGALGLRFGASGVVVRRIPINSSTLAFIDRGCYEIYTGQSRISSDTIEAVIGAYRAKDAHVLRALGKMRQNAESMVDALATSNVDTLGVLVREQWSYQRSLHPAIPTPLIDEIIERGMAAGAVGAKALGASGGGCVLLIAGTRRADDVRAAVAPLGEILPLAIDEHGVERCQ
jgi:D-glycero-alpha-D-manno-heptose-7-phosphate kinase